MEIKLRIKKERKIKWRKKKKIKRKKDIFNLFEIIILKSTLISSL